MKIIKFRGKHIDTGKWVYGYLLSPSKIGKIEDIHHSYSDVDPKTVGQYTGLKDKKGVEIYEGDTVDYPTQEPYRDGCFGVVIYRSDLQGFVIHHPDNLPIKKFPKEWVPLFSYNDNLSTASKFEVTSNIYENPELLEKE